MALIVEDGAGTDPDANSYSDVDSLRLYADARGEDLSEQSDEDCEVLMIKAMDFIEAKRDRFKGRKTRATQPLQWPRDDVYDVDHPGAKTPNNVIPRELEYAQFSLAIIAKDNDLMPNRFPDDKGSLVNEKIAGVIEKTYDKNNHASFVPAFAKPESLLQPLYKSQGLFLVRS